MKKILALLVISLFALPFAFAAADDTKVHGKNTIDIIVAPHNLGNNTKAIIENLENATAEHAIQIPVAPIAPGLGAPNERMREIIVNPASNETKIKIYDIVTDEHNATKVKIYNIVADSGNATKIMVHSVIASSEANQTKIKVYTVIKDEYNKTKIKIFDVLENATNETAFNVENITADSELQIEQEQVQNMSRLHAILSNGKRAEIKIMPDTASATAIEKIGLHVCNESTNCTIVLKEVGQGNQTRATYEIQTRAAYEIRAMKQVKILGIIGAKEENTVQVDAENGAVIAVHRPWWSFLAFSA